MNRWLTELLDFKHMLRAAGYSYAGLVAAYRAERAIRMETTAFVILAPLALWLGDTGLERAVLIASLLLVLILELANSALEATVDRVGRERNELSGRAKDMGSAAVFIALVNVLVVWALVLLG